MFWFFLGAAVVGAAVFLRLRFAAFPSQKPSDYASDKGNMMLSDYLNGAMVCRGVLYGPMGKVVSRFIADMAITWDGRHGRMNELFTYDSGNTQSRVWELEMLGGGKIRATASDFVGEATGTISGTTLCMKYKFKLPDDAGGHVLNVTDWMYVLDDGTFVNRSQFRKFGIKVAELVATFAPKG